jgi:uncharacterized repeat protein (TIGR01451 family)
VTDGETVPVPTPSLATDKALTGNADEDGSGNVSVGDTLTYTITVTNTGTANLTDVTVSDDLTGDSTTCALVPPGGTCVLVTQYVVTAADADAGQIDNVGTGDSDQTGPEDDPETVPVPDGGVTGAITPTDTTCQDFRDGTFSTIAELVYDVRRGEVNRVAEGVIFYYSKITAPAESFTIQVGQMLDPDDLGWPKMSIQNARNVILWNPDCIKHDGVVVDAMATGEPTITVSGATPGDMYFLSVKFETDSVKGTPVSEPLPTITYSFDTSIDGGEQNFNAQSVNMVPKQ